jgi:hypothetical protein
MTTRAIGYLVALFPKDKNFMSRHKIDHKAFEIAVGWDRALNTFFAIVDEYDNESEDELPLVWLGTTVGEYSNAGEFLAILTTKLEPLGLASLVPQSLLSTLVQDQTVEGYGYEERPEVLRALVRPQSDRK